MTPSLTIYYPPYSRFDKENGLVPFSGAPGRMFIHRTIDTVPNLEVTIRPQPEWHARPTTTHALILGADACGALLSDRNINKHRGYRKTLHHSQAIVTYSHLDSWDFKDEDDEDSQDGDDKDVAITKRSNYLYWALRDFKKLFTPTAPHSARQTELNPSARQMADLLDRAPTGLHISLDIETRVQDNTLDCIGFGLLLPKATYIYTFPIYGPDNLLRHSRPDIARFWRSFYHALLRPDLVWVGHNLAFDLSILHHHYHLPFPRRIHDTMLTMHRDNPFVDKSLSHAISAYTDANENHKGNLVPNISDANFRQLLVYNADDVYWTGEVYKRQPKSPAVDQVNDSQYVCLMMSFTGIEIDTQAREEKISSLTLKTGQLLRIIRILSGRPEFNPNSGKQIADYFYTHLTYEPPALTDAGEPATDEKSLLKLQLKQPNPLIPLILAYKAASKEESMLNFTPYEKHPKA